MTKKKDPERTYTYADISAATGVKPVTIRAWRRSGKLPAPDFTIGQSPVWNALRIEPWIRVHTGLVNIGNGRALTKTDAGS